MCGTDVIISPGAGNFCSLTSQKGVVDHEKSDVIQQSRGIIVEEEESDPLERARYEIPALATKHIIVIKSHLLIIRHLSHL